MRVGREGGLTRNGGVAALCDEPAAFAYHRSVAPMLWVLVVIGSVELIVTHVLIALWRPTVALALSCVTFGAMIWLVALIRSMRLRPVLLGQETLLMRVGFFRKARISRTAVRGVRQNWAPGAQRAPHILNMALVAYPNLIIELAKPLPGRRSRTAVAHRLDDAPAFIAALGVPRLDPA